MTVTLLLEQALNGLQFGLMLFLLAAGLIETTLPVGQLAVDLGAQP